MPATKSGQCFERDLAAGADILIAQRLATSRPVAVCSKKHGFLERTRMHQGSRIAGKGLICFSGGPLLAFVAVITVCGALGGCASKQYGHLLAGDDKDMVGSHAAGAATWNPLVDESVAKMLGRCPPAIQ